MGSLFSSSRNTFSLPITLSIWILALAIRLPWYTSDLVNGPIERTNGGKTYLTLNGK